MAWFKVDDGFYSSRKVLMIPRSMRLACIGAWSLAGTWSAKELTDGHIPEYVLDELGAIPEIRDELIRVGLWLDDGAGGVRFHDWDVYQPSRDEVLAKRGDLSRKRSEAGKKGMASRWDNKITNGLQNDNPDPTRPDPLTTPKGVVRATRIPNDFTVTSEMAEWAKAKHPHVDLVTQTDAFRDYWVGVAGAKAVKRDWIATWRNWIRNSKPVAGQRTTAFDRNMETVRMFEQQAVTA